MRHLLPLLVLLALAGCRTSGPGSAEATAEEVRTVRLGERQLALDGFAGDVSVTAVAGLDEVEVVFTKRATGATQTQAEGRLSEIRIEEAGDDALYQYVWRSDLDGTAVDADVRVPFSADVVIRLGAGEIEVDELRGPLDAQTGSGSIRVDHLRSPTVRLETGAGDITAGAAFLSEGADWDIETGSGTLILLVPETASVRIRAESRAGSLDLDPALPLTDADESGGPANVDFAARMGDGDARLRATTGAGDVELLRYRPPQRERPSQSPEGNRDSTAHGGSRDTTVSAD